MAHKLMRALTIMAVSGAVTGLLAALLCLLAAQASPPAEKEKATDRSIILPQVTAAIPLSPGIGFDPVAVGVNPASGYTYVANARSNDISILCGTQVITNVSVTASPSTIAVNEATGYVYVALSTGDLAVLSGTEVVTTLMGVEGDVMSVNPATGLIYAAKPGGNSVSVLDGPRVIATATVESGLTNMGVAPNSSLVYVTAYQGSYPDYTGTVSVLSGTQWITTITGLVGELKAVGVNPVNGYLYVGNSSNIVTVLSGTQVITEVPLQYEMDSWVMAIEVNPATGYVYVMGHSGGSYGGFVAVLSDTHLIGILAADAWTRPAAMTMNPTNGNIYVAYTLCYHCSDVYYYFTSTLVVLNGAQFSRIGIEGDLSAVGTNPNNGYIYAVNRGAGFLGASVTVLSDAQTIGIIRGRSPTAVRVDPGTGGRVYIADRAHQSVAVMQGLQIIADVDVDLIPQYLATNPATGLAYVAGLLRYTDVPSGAVAILRDTQVVTCPNVGMLPLDVEVNSTSGYVYVANAYSHDVSVLSGTQVITTVAVWTAPGYAGPSVVKTNPTNGYVYVGSSNSISVISGTHVITTVLTGDFFPWFIGINPASGYVYVMDNGRLDSQMNPFATILVMSETQVITMITVSEWPTGIGINPASGYAYVAHHTTYPVTNFLTILSGTQVVTTVTTGESVSAIAPSPTSGYVYAAGLNTVSVLSGTKVVATLPVDSPVDIAVNPVNGLVYVSNYYGRSITVITDPIAYKPWKVYLPLISSAHN